ncbi:hypothetical protein DL764_004711 [Monosporascus ibericus]|uniref:Fe2OG dioxygenase domain-containing protein n=1 Tax=Monosporascus ibericus TaxID=155417 RepID=A0A4Q4TF39_9PEZI|nr:hypothetical protein DL764_004711 [Monosporascus ibericus]
MGAGLSWLAEEEDPWFNPELRNKRYDEFGDAYRDDVENRPYLAYVRQLSQQGWIHLRLLADFMQIGTHPQRWKDLKPERSSGEKSEEAEKDRKRRAEKTEVTVLDYCANEVKKTGPIQSAADLRKELDRSIAGDDVRLRLYVVEDLSRDVIEVLGQKLKIEPDVFRSHIVDYAWYNVLDRWRDPPYVGAAGRPKNWTQLRYVTARYFETRDKFKEAGSEAQQFNVLRRPDDDHSNKAWWDEPGAVVGLTRSRATFWLQEEQSGSEPRVGVLFLDPTVRAGLPLWRGRRILHQTPQFEPKLPPQSENQKNASKQRDPYNNNSFYEDFIYWAQQLAVFPASLKEHVSSAHVPMQALLHLICSEWLTMSDYIKTRLNQVDLEIVNPRQFVAPGHHVSDEKLHMWRRFIPLYREMVSEILERVFHFPCYRETSRPRVMNGTHPENHTIQQLAAGNNATTSIIDTSTTNSSPSASQSTTCPGGDQSAKASGLGSIGNYEDDFRLVLRHLEEYQSRINHVTSVITAVMSIADSRRALEDNYNIGRLTWLATFFIPFSLIAGAFSMTDDISTISNHTVRLYFAVSVPLAFVTAIAALVMSRPKIKSYSAALQKGSMAKWKGFVYIVNHGIANNVLEEAFRFSRGLFALPRETKMLAPHPPGPNVHRGYSWPGLEKVAQDIMKEGDEATEANNREIADVKESYEIGSEDFELQPNVWLPEDVLPGFRSFMTQFYWTCFETAKELLRALALGVGLEAEDFFLNYHSGESNQLRLLHYPPVEGEKLSSNVVARMPAHSDWGSITMLFQDETGGLQVEDPKNPGSFLGATPMKNALIMNVGDLLMRLFEVDDASGHTSPYPRRRVS